MQYGLRKSLEEISFELKGIRNVLASMWYSRYQNGETDQLSPDIYSDEYITTEECGRRLSVSEGLLGFGFWAITYEGSDRSFWVMVDSYSHNNQQPITPSQTITINPVVPGVAGNLNTLSAVGITPNALVGFLAGVGQGQVQIPNCAGWVPAGSARLVGVATANNAGAVSLGLWIPRTARNRTFQVWAYDQTTCQISQPITISL